LTKKIYERQSYIKEYRTKVTDCWREDTSVYIKLEETIFFPMEGGQYADKGVLEYDNSTVEVIDGELIGSATEGETDIRYLVDCEIAPGTDVLCKLDWSIRFDRMQNHSGEHILSGIVHRKYGYNNVGFHLSDDDVVTLAFDHTLTNEQVRELEWEANSVIYKNFMIKDTYPSVDELSSIDYRSKIDIKGQVRLITIGDDNETIDVCACCAPHVSHTGAIGIIKIISSVKYKGGTQLGILCGRRALDYIIKNMDNLESIARGFSTSIENVPTLVDGLKEDKINLSTKVAILTESSIIERIKSQESDRCIFSSIELSAANMKNIFNELASLRSGYVGVFCGNDDDGYRYYAGAKDKDASNLAELMKNNLGAKGGGSREMIQGKINKKRTEIESFWKEYT